MIKLVIGLAIVITLFVAGPLLFSPFFAGTGGEGETVSNGTVTATVSGDDFAVGEVTDDIRPALKALYRKAGSDVNVPAYLLAAIGQQECGRVNQLTDETLQDLIASNKPFPIRQQEGKTDLGHMGCAYDNGSNVWGPMQFQFMTFFGYPTCSSYNRVAKRCVEWSWENKKYTDRWASSFVAQNPSYHPSAFPAPKKNSNGDLATTVIRRLNPDSAITSRPASIISLKDAVYAAAIYLRSSAGRKDTDTSPWTEDQLKKSACRYYGACGDAKASYWADVRKKIEKYKAKIAS